jgi:hypothetical protein
MALSALCAAVRRCVNAELAKASAPLDVGREHARCAAWFALRDMLAARGGAHEQLGRASDVVARRVAARRARAASALAARLRAENEAAANDGARRRGRGAG